ncbi:hypothetical protein A2U01_0004024 [Trifolium medium]|uniref:Uncharacterized protein n=1 Tax=Trifolium medium TaxID=97028 RepID=A0A392M727_9FABA|nr:hypothetical protein [Trifolium medium]
MTAMKLQEDAQAQASNPSENWDQNHNREGSMEDTLQRHRYRRQTPKVVQEEVQVHMELGNKAEAQTTTKRPRLEASNTNNADTIMAGPAKHASQAP